jgi:hypothetical protein
MTKTVNEGEDAGAATAQGNLLSVSLAVWILWPAAFVLIFRDVEYDFVGAVLREYFVYPHSLINVTDYWIRGEPIYKSLYLSTWCVNAAMIAVRYAGYLVEHPHHMTELEGQYPLPKLMALGVFGLVVLFTFGSSMVFDPAMPLLDEARLLVGNDLGLMIALPMLYVGWACSPVVSAFFFYAAVCKIFFRKGRGLK